MAFILPFNLIQPEQPLVVNGHGSSRIKKPGKYKGANLIYSN